MKYLISILLVLSIACQTSKDKVFIPKNEIIQTVSDSTIFREKIQELSSHKDKALNELIIEVGKSFIGTPYVAHTLENNPDEKLVVNLRELDCTTFAENCLAITQCLISEDSSFEDFLLKLQNIRYRNSVRNKYTSRLHYFSEWLLNNSEKGFITLTAKEIGSPYPNKLNFMSTHPDSYECLKGNPEFVSELAAIEKNISVKEYYYIPKDKVAEIEEQLKEGDIVGITTNIDGLDMVHTVLLTRQNGRVHLLHASSAAKKVVISEQTLVDYLNASKIRSGIMIGRPIK